VWKGLFEQLVERVRESANILRGRRKPSRSLAFEETPEEGELVDAAERIFLELDRREQARMKSPRRRKPGPSRHRRV